MGIFGKEKPIKEYSINGRKFYLYEVTPKRKKKLERNQQNQEAHLRNMSWAGLFGSLAEMAAIYLTPEGDHPDRKDIHAVQEELRDLPYRFITEVIDDIYKIAAEAAAARGK